MQRRDVLKLSFCVLAGLASPPFAVSKSDEKSSFKREHIWAHYEQDATKCWKLREGGYATAMSIRRHETVTFHISNSRSYFDIHIFHEGARRTLVKEIVGLRGKMQNIPEYGYRDGFDWEETVSFRIPDDWKSGVYIASFPTGQGPREILFVVRPETPSASILATIETNTYNAYNPVGGKCFFPYISSDRIHSELLSFERPLQPDFMGGFYAWDQFFTSWLDAENYEIDYCINSDIDNEPGILENYKAHLRIGHGEYTSRSECEQIQRFVKSGGNLMTFAGNAFWHLVETRNNGRQLYCNKTRYVEHPLGSPDNPATSFLCSIDNLRQKTIGVYYTSSVNSKTAVPGVFLAPTTEEYGFFRVAQAGHWAFQGTNLLAGDEFGRADSIVGVECDAGDIVLRDGKPYFTGSDGISPHYKILAIADAAGGQLNVDLGIKHDKFYCTMAINENEFKGTVFTAATMEWGHGLYRDSSPLAQITRNVLDRLSR